MKKIESLAGKSFGQWTVTENKKKAKSGHWQWECVCSCGDRRYVYQTHLVTGKTSMCKNCATVTHGLTKTPSWISWRAMRDRCLNKNHPAFHRYGGRGITVCDRWASFEHFYADMGERKDGFSIERIDNNGMYEKENCVWSDRQAQANNRVDNKIVEWCGEKYTVSNLARKLGIKYQTLAARIRRGRGIDGGRLAV